jgi:hypothetical protein
MSKYQVSNIEMGTFRDGKWYCCCGIPAEWYTSKTEATNGEKCRVFSFHQSSGSNLEIVARCPKSRDEGCSFYLWEKDDLAARASKITEEQEPSLPQTPSKRQRTAAQGRTETYSLPAPNSRSYGIHTGIRKITLQSPNETPTPQRYHNFQISSNYGESDLFTEVNALLQSVEIRLKSSTEVKLRHIIKMRVESYETQIRTCQETITELSKRLAETE